MSVETKRADSETFLIENSIRKALWKQGEPILSAALRRDRVLESIRILLTQGADATSLLERLSSAEEEYRRSIEELFKHLDMKVIRGVPEDVHSYTFEIEFSGRRFKVHVNPLIPSVLCFSD